MTENERKFVLKLNCENQIEKIAFEKLEVSQGYINNLRFRKIKNKKENYYMTFKFNTEERIIEIETKIDERDFNDIWNKCFNKVYKIRYKLYDWDVDFFKDHNNHTYFSMAEIEMPEGMKEPKTIPEFIKSNLVYKVSANDCKFSSKALSDIRHAKDLFKKIVDNY